MILKDSYQKIIKTGLLFFIGIVTVMLFTFSKKKTQVNALIFNPKIIHEYYHAQLDELQSTINRMTELNGRIDKSSMKERFKSARLLYKKIECFVDFYYRESAIKLNAANLPEANPNHPQLVLYPSGFQVLEEVLFSEETSKSDIQKELNQIQHTLEHLQNISKNLPLTESNVLYAIRLNLYRSVSKGVSGFDSPVALHSIPELLATLESTKVYLSSYKLNNDLLDKCDSAIRYVNDNLSDFEAFDRAIYISEYLNPLCISLHDYQKAEKIIIPNQPNSPFNPNAPTLFSKNAFDPLFFAPSDAIALTKENISLGKKLFEDNQLSVDGTRNCTTCHLPNKYFTDGLKSNISLGNKNQLKRNTPTLLNAALQASQFYDSRITYLEDQAHLVITNNEEMGGTFSNILLKINNDKSYQKEFKTVFGKKKITEREVKLALAAYVRTLITFNSPFDNYMRGNSKAMTKNEIDGFNLFMGKAKCATCHFVPLFNGTVPPFYDKTESEVLGIPDVKKHQKAKLDTDEGKYAVFHIPHHRFSFKTTTVRETEFTAPYMHNGIFETLEDVIDFYNNGGGSAYGFDLPNQTLPSDSLHLSESEKSNLIAFIKALSTKE